MASQQQVHGCAGGLCCRAGNPMGSMNRIRAIRSHLVAAGGRMRGLGIRLPRDRFAREVRCNAASNGDQLNAMEEKVIKERFDKAGELLNTILNEICKEMLMLAPDDIAYEPADEERVVAKVVDKFLADLDQNFLAVVEAYETQATEAGLEMRKLIRKVRFEVLKQINQQLPPEIQVLERLTHISDKEERILRIKEATNPHGTSDWQTTRVKLFRTAHQFICEIEECGLVVDRKLLAQLCTVREETRLLEMEASYQGTGDMEPFESVGQKVSSRSFGFLQQLLQVSLSGKRTALLQKAFAEDWIGKPVGSKDESYASDKKITDRIVRPGKFMMCLASTQQKLDQMNKVEEGVQTRIEEIRQEAMYALRLLAWGDFSREEIEENDKKIQEMPEAQNISDDNYAGKGRSDSIGSNGELDDKWINNMKFNGSPGNEVDN